MTNKAKVITLPKGTLVTFGRQTAVGKGGNKPERTYFLDSTSDGLSVGDKVYEFYEAKGPGKRPGSLIYGNDNPFPRTEIRERSLTAADIRKYKTAFKKRFKKLVRTARAHRLRAKKIPKITSGKCSAYWAIVRNRRVVSRPILPDGKIVRFSPSVTISTKVSERGLKGPRVRYDVKNPGSINPTSCVSLQAKSKIILRGRRTPMAATVSAGGILRYPIWMIELFGTKHFKYEYPSYVAQVGVDYMLGGNQYIHLALNDPARLAVVWR